MRSDFRSDFFYEFEWGNLPQYHVRMYFESCTPDLSANWTLTTLMYEAFGTDYIWHNPLIRVEIHQ